MAQDTLDDRADDVLGIIKRAEDVGESHIAHELGGHADASQVAKLLHRLEHEGRVTRTAGGTWRLTPATEMHTEARPDPREPRQG
jgi:DNA-binding IclR family transcriptional regulator